MGEQVVTARGFGARYFTIPGGPYDWNPAEHGLEVPDEDDHTDGSAIVVLGNRTFDCSVASGPDGSIRLYVPYEPTEDQIQAILRHVHDLLKIGGY